jgi:hypothetical protein
MQFAKAKTPRTLVKATTTSGKRQKVPLGSQNLEKVRLHAEKHALGGSHAKNQRRNALVETTYDRQYRAGAVRATRCV